VIKDVVVTVISTAKLVKVARRSSAKITSRNVSVEGSTVLRIEPILLKRSPTTLGRSFFAQMGQRMGGMKDSLKISRDMAVEFSLGLMD